MKDRLTTKQRRFVDAYDGNATEAARQAGYRGSQQTLGSVGKENLQKPHIRAAIQEREDKAAAAKIATRAERQAFWTSVMRDEKEETRDRLKASELLGRSNADFVERVETTGDITVAIKIPDCWDADDHD